MKTLLIFILTVAGASAQSPSPTPSPTPPALKPLFLRWLDTNSPTRIPPILYYNIYKKIGTTYFYVSTVYVPSPLQWAIPVGTVSGTFFNVTASDGAQESPKALLDGTVPGVPSAVTSLTIEP